MPEMTGVQFLEKVNKKYSTIPPNRLIVSGYAENEEVEKAFKEYNLFKFISKPWDYDEMKELILEGIKDGEKKMNNQ